MTAASKDAVWLSDPQSGASLDSTAGNPFVITGDAGRLWAVDIVGTEMVSIDLGRVTS